jgi:putative transposase
MAGDFRPGARAVYQGLPVIVREDACNGQVLIELEGALLHVPQGQLLPVPDPASVLSKLPIAAIPADEWDEAHRRAVILRELQSLDVGRTQAVREAALRMGVSERQLWRMAKDFEKTNTVTSLLPASPGRKAGSRLLDSRVEQIICELIDSVFLVPERPTVKALKERIDAKCRAEGLAPPSHGALSRRLESYRTKEHESKRLGRKKAKYTYDPMPGHVEVTACLERVEIDHTPLDVIVRSDDALCDFAARPWLTVAMDVYSRCILGIHIGFEPPSALSVALCLSHAVSPKNPEEEFGVPIPWPMCGLPTTIVVDNGKDFVSKAFQRGCDEKNIILQYRPVGSPHYGGAIERLIGSMVGQCHILPGTTKRSVAERGDYVSAKHASMTLREVRTWFVEQVLGRYHLKEHRTLRIPPLRAWERGMEAKNDRQAS